MTTRTWKQTGLVLALVGTTAFAQEATNTERPSREEMIAKYDADGDGVLSEAEKATLQAEMGQQRGQRGQRGQQGGQRMSREEMTAKYDTDGDGVLSETEKSAMRTEMGQQRGQRGQQQGGERGQRMSTEDMFTKYDADGNGQLSKTEFTTMQTEMSAQRTTEGRQRGQRGGATAEQGTTTKRMTREEMIAKYDTDKDGKLSETERATLRADLAKQKETN